MQRSWFICAFYLLLLSIGTVACGEDRDVVEEDEQQVRSSTSKGRGSKNGQKRGANSKKGEEVSHTDRRKDVPRPKKTTNPASNCFTSLVSHMPVHATPGAGLGETAQTSVDAEEATKNAYSNLSSQARSNTTAPQDNKDVREQPEHGHKAVMCTTVPVDDMITTNQGTAQQDTSEGDMMHNQDVDTTVQTDASHSFSIKLKPETHGNSPYNFVLVELTHTTGMQLQNFSVTASLSDEKGIVRGGSGKQGTSFIYNKELNQCNLRDLFFQDVQKKDDSLTYYKAISFRVKVQPSAAIEPGEEYILTIEIHYTGDHLGEAHTATKQTFLKAQSKSPSPKKHAKCTSPKK